MSDPDELRFSEMRAKRGQSPPPRPPEEPSFNAREFASVRTLPPPPPPPREPDDTEEAAGFKLPVDQARIAMALKRRWVWLLAAACLGTLLGFAGGYFKVPYKIKVTLIMREASTAFAAGMVGESYRPEQLTVQTLVDLVKSPELIHRVATAAGLSEGRLKSCVEAKQELQTDLVSLIISGKSPPSLRELATNYVNAAVALGKELQISDTIKMNKFYKERIATNEVELNHANAELLAFQKEKGLVDPEVETRNYVEKLSALQSRYSDARIDSELADLEIELLGGEKAQNPLAQRLAAAKQRLADLLTTLTEAHYSVQGQRKIIADLERQLALAGTNAVPVFTSSDGPRTNTLAQALLRKKMKILEMEKVEGLERELWAKVTGISTNGLRYASLKATVDSLKDGRAKLIRRQSETQLYEDNAQGFYRLFGIQDIDMKARWMGVAKFTLIGFVLGMLAAGAVVAGIEVLDDSLKTTVDVQRVTGLPMLATLGDLDAMSLEERDGWAFRTWTALSGQLSPSPNHGMVCGFISSLPGEGRSTWINLLVNAAGQRGFRVLTVATRPPRSDPETGTATATETEREFGEAISRALAATKTEAPEQVANLTPQALVFPAEVTRQLTGPNAPPVAHIPLPGWVWNLERRKQWQSALAHWRAIDNLVLLVELPPASVPESVLLAENLPQLIWLVDSGQPRTRATREQLETLRYAKCRLVGAVLNHEPKPVFEL